MNRIIAAMAIGLLANAASPQELQRITVAGEQAILARPGIEITGAPHPDVTIVEYFDYNCPYCKRLDPTFKQLLAADKKIALVFKDWPVLGEVSEYAARCALAAQWQGKYLAAHDALLYSPRLSRDDVVESVLQGAGIDLKKLKKDLTSHSREIAALLARHEREARALELDGTPGVLVGGLLVPGGADLSYFQRGARSPQRVKVAALPATTLRPCAFARAARRRNRAL
jgi:protein-disulfide isomerase